MDKAKGGRFEGGRWGWVECGTMVGQKWRQLYLNNNEKKRKEKAKQVPAPAPGEHADREGRWWLEPQGQWQQARKPLAGWLLCLWDLGVNSIMYNSLLFLQVEPLPSSFSIPLPGDLCSRDGGQRAVAGWAPSLWISGEGSTAARVVVEHDVCQRGP